MRSKTREGDRDKWKEVNGRRDLRIRKWNDKQTHMDAGVMTKNGKKQDNSKEKHEKRAIGKR